MARRARVDRAPAVLDDGAHRALHHGKARQQHDRIEVALQGGARLHARGGVGQRGSPVHPDDRRAGLRHRAKQLGRADPEVRHRHTGVGERGEHPAAVRQHGAAVVGQRQRARPRIEHLNRVHAGVHLDLQKRDRDVGQRCHQGVPGLGFAQHHRLGAFVVPAGAALDEIGRQRERRAREPDERDVAQLRHQLRHRLRDRRNLVRLKCFHGLDVGEGAHGMLDHRPDIGHDVQLDARCAQGHHDVGEQDRRVHPVPADGLQRDLGDQFGVEARLHHGVLGPQRPVLGQRPACLPHEPHRHAAGFAAGGCGQIGRLGQLAAGSHRLQCCHAASAVEIVVLVLAGRRGARPGLPGDQVRRPRPRRDAARDRRLVSARRVHGLSQSELDILRRGLASRTTRANHL